MRNRDGGIGRPISIVAAVERAFGTKQRDVNAHHAADTEHQLRSAADMRGSIEEQPRVCLEFVAMRVEDVAEMIGSSLFFAFEEELDVHRRCAAKRLERVERRQHRHDGSFIVTRRACADAHFRIDGGTDGRQRHGVGRHAILEAPKLRRERLAIPPATGNWLAIIVRVEHHGAGRPARHDLTEQRRASS